MGRGKRSAAARAQNVSADPTAAVVRSSGTGAMQTVEPIPPRTRVGGTSNGTAVSPMWEVMQGLPLGIAGSGVGGEEHLPVFSLDDTFMTRQPVALLPFEDGPRDNFRRSASPISSTSDGSSRPEGSQPFTFHHQQRPVGGGRSPSTNSSSDSASDDDVLLSPPRELAHQQDPGEPFPLSVDRLRPNLNVAPPNWLVQDDRHYAHRHTDSWNPTAGTEGVLELLSHMVASHRRLEDDAASQHHQDTTGRASAQCEVESFFSSDSYVFGPVPGPASLMPAAASSSAATAHHPPPNDLRDERDEPTSPRERLPDVICSAEDLKQLLLAPHTDHPFALMVHRVGPSIVLESAGTYHQAKAARVKDTRRRALFSKLLYYSIMADGDLPPGLPGRQQEEYPQLQQNATGTSTPPAGLPPAGKGKKKDSAGSTNARATAHHQLTPPLGPQAAPAPLPSFSAQESSHFRRSLQWSFNDLRILLGVDTPILRRTETSEDMTLQVHEEDEYVSKVEALEYWLDNIMCQMDKVAICYHRDGVVQGYQVVNTQDIPELSSESFEPIAIQSQATRVLHWLKAVCSKPCGSYVVVKDSSTNELKVYDLAKVDVLQKDTSSTTQTRNVTRSKCAAVEAEKRSAPSASSLVTNGSAGTLATAAIDETGDEADGEEGRELKEPKEGESTTEAVRMFRYPIAMMCYRMAQCLPNSDAEAQRLLQQCTDLLGSSVGSTDEEHAPVFASCHARAMLHFHSSSPLQDAEERCLTHAMTAVEALQRMFRRLWRQESEAKELLREDKKTSSPMSENRKQEEEEEHMFQLRKARQWADSMREARGLTNVVMRCLCAVAIQKLKEVLLHVEAYWTTVRILLMLQSLLLLRHREIPFGLIAQKDSNGTLDSPEPEGATTTSTTTATADDPSLSLSLTDPVRTELIACLAGVETIVGDLFHYLLAAQSATPQPATSGAGSNTSGSGETSGIAVRKAVMKSLLTARRTTVYHVAVGFFHEQTIPSHLDFLSHFDYLPTADDETLLELGVAAFNRALAHHALLQHRPRELRRKLGGLHSQLGAARSSVLSKTLSLMGNDKDAKLNAIDHAAGPYQRAAEYFSLANDGTNTIMMRTNLARLTVRRAELYVEEQSTVYVPAEIAQLKRAVNEIDRAVGSAVGKSGTKQDDEGTKRQKGTPTTPPTPGSGSGSGLSEPSQEILAGALTTRGGIKQTVAVRLLAVATDKANRTGESIPQIASSILQLIDGAGEDYRQAKALLPQRSAALALLAAEAHMLVARSGIQQTEKSAGSDETRERIERNIALAITKYRSSLSVFYAALNEQAPKCVIGLCEAYELSSRCVANTKPSSTTTTAAIDDALLENAEKAVTTLCDFRGWLAHHLEQWSTVGTQGSSARRSSNQTHIPVVAVSPGEEKSKLSSADSVLLHSNPRHIEFTVFHQLGEAIATCLTKALLSLIRCVSQGGEAGSAKLKTNLSQQVSVLLKAKPTAATRPSSQQVDQLSYLATTYTVLNEVSALFAGFRKKAKR